MEKIVFSFDGGIADANELNFYEAGRFSYGAARLIYTLELFRQEKRIVQRLSSKVKADIRVRAAERGSFVQEVLIVVAPIATQCALQVPFQAIFSYAWNLLLPPTRGQQAAVEIAKYRVQEEQERTRQTELLTNVANNSNATTQQALDILRDTIEQKPQTGVVATQMSINEIIARANELEGFQNRRAIVSEYDEQFRTIKPEQERKLASQVRKPVAEIALPLRSSAMGLNIGETAARPSYARISAESGAFISAQNEDLTPTTLRGSIRAYDKETGYGKFEYAERTKPIGFRVLSALKIELLSKILDAMGRESALIVGYLIRDNYGEINSMIIEDILEDE